MSHPVTYADDDLYLAEIRRLALAVAEVSELLEASYRQVALRRQITALDRLV